MLPKIFGVTATREAQYDGIVEAESAEHATHLVEAYYAGVGSTCPSCHQQLMREPLEASDDGEITVDFVEEIKPEDDDYREIMMNRGYLDEDGKEIEPDPKS